MARQQTLEQRTEQHGALARLARVTTPRSAKSGGPRPPRRRIHGHRAFAGARPGASFRERAAAALALAGRALLVTSIGGEGRAWT